MVTWKGRLGHDHTEEQQPAGLRVPAALVIGWLAVKFSLSFLYQPPQRVRIPFMLDLVVEWPAAVCLTFQPPLRNWQRTPAPWFLREMPSGPSHCEGRGTRWRERGTRSRMTLLLSPKRQNRFSLCRITEDPAHAAWLCIFPQTILEAYGALQISWVLHAGLRRAAGFRSQLHHNEIEITVKRQQRCLIRKWFFLSKAKFKRVSLFFLNAKLFISLSFCEVSLRSVQAVILDPRAHERVNYFSQSVLSWCTNHRWAPLRHTEPL